MELVILRSPTIRVSGAHGFCMPAMPARENDIKGPELFVL